MYLCFLVYAFFLKDLRLTQDQKETDFYFVMNGEVFLCKLALNQRGS